MNMTNSSAFDCFVDGKAWPPGFRFHPSDEELVLYYLKRKICRRRLKLDVIAETDVYKWDPEDLPGKSILRTGDKQWFFFSTRDRKYPHGVRSNRATGHGYWKATGKDRSVTCNSRTVGTKKTLIFYRGRAPTGERTDWVMHEYAVDEEELKRCQTGQDYYVLYKVYKKSGPGPKNGEQYGAPFKEEEWGDDEYSDVNNHAVVAAPVKVNAIPSVDNIRVDGQIQSSLNDIEEIANRIVDDRALGQLHMNGDAYAPQDVGIEGTQSTMLDQLVKETIVAEPRIVLHPISQQYGVQDGFDITPYTSQLHFYEAPKVTSPNISEELHITEDFLEIDDLIGPEPSLPNVEKPVENFLLEELDESEFDLFHDVAMFIRDINPVDQGLVANPYLNNFENEMVNQLPHEYDAEPINSQLWTCNNSIDVFTSAESYQGAIPLPVTDAVRDGTSTDIFTQGNQNLAGNDNGDEDQWFTSALWSFVDSIPTTPASASENAIVNRALERISSFGRVRISARNADVAAVSNRHSVLKGKEGRKGFFFFSLVGAVCAILWVLMKGTVMSFLGIDLPL